MIKIVDGKLDPCVLSYDGVLSDNAMKDYNYISMKNDFEMVIDALEMNILRNSIYKHELEYRVNEKLEFITFCRDPRKNEEDMEIFTFDREILDNNPILCVDMLNKFKSAWNRLSEVEKYVIKCLYFDNEHTSDEEIIDRLLTYKNKYLLIKKSSYIKMNSFLAVRNATIAYHLNDEIISSYKLISFNENMTKIEDMRENRLYNH